MAMLSDFSSLEVSQKTLLQTAAGFIPNNTSITLGEHGATTKYRSDTFFLGNATALSEPGVSADEKLNTVLVIPDSFHQVFDNALGQNVPRPESILDEVGLSYDQWMCWWNERIGLYDYEFSSSTAEFKTIETDSLSS